MLPLLTNLYNSVDPSNVHFMLIFFIVLVLWFVLLHFGRLIYDVVKHPWSYVYSVLVITSSGFLIVYHLIPIVSNLSSHALIWLSTIPSTVSSLSLVTTRPAFSSLAPALMSLILPVVWSGICSIYISLFKGPDVLNFSCSVSQK